MAISAKYGAGSLRDATDLGDGRIAVSGQELRRAGGQSGAGLWIVDVLTWRARRVVDGARSFSLSPPVLVTQSDGWVHGVAIDGRRLWSRRFNGIFEAHAGRAYLRYSARRPGRRRIHVLDVRNGAVERTLRRSRMPLLLVP